MRDTLAPPNVLLKMALDAIADETMLPVLGDLIQELRWYDERVVTICLLPADKPRRRILSPSVRQKRRAVKNRVVLEGPWIFHRLSAAPTSALARAVAAVLIFGEWPTRPFGSLYRAWRARSTWPVSALESVRNT